MTAATPIDHVAAALARLPVYLRKQRWQELVEVMAAPFQFYEDVLNEMLRQDDPRQAKDDRLDQIGATVGVAREQRADAAYLRGILAGIATHRSRGMIDDVLLLARLLSPDTAAVITRTGTAAYLLSLEGAVTDDDTASEIAAALPLTHKAGVRAGLYHYTVAPSLAFSFAGGPGPGFASGARASATITSTGTVVRLRTPGAWGNEQVIELVDDWSTGEGELDETNLAPAGGIVYYHYQPGVSTASDLEVALAASTRLAVTTASSTPALVLTSGAAAQHTFSGGTDAGGVFGRRHLE